MTSEEAKLLVETRLAKYIGADLEQQHILASLCHETQICVAILKSKGFKVLSNFSPYFTFQGLTTGNEIGDYYYIYQQRSM